MKQLLFSVMLLLLLTSTSQREAQGPVYIIHSDEGSLLRDGKKGGLLIMQQVDQTVPFVYSHPRRRVGAEHLPDFMRVWASGNQLQFNNDLPDAHLLYYNSSIGDYINLLVELTELDYNEKQNSIQFKILFKEENPTVKEDLGEVTLFVDCFPFCA